MMQEKLMNPQNLWEILIEFFQNKYDIGDLTINLSTLVKIQIIQSYMYTKPV